MGYPQSSGGDGMTAAQEADLSAATAASHTHSNSTILDAIESALTTDQAAKVDAIEAPFTAARAAKLDSLESKWKGSFDNDTALVAEYPTPGAGWGAWDIATETLWYAKNGVWVDSGLSSTGDMLAAVHDPQGVGADAFDRANHTGTQSISTIFNLALTLESKASDTDIAELDYRITENSGDISSIESMLADYDKIGASGVITLTSAFYPTTTAGVVVDNLSTILRRVNNNADSYITSNGSAIAVSEGVWQCSLTVHTYCQTDATGTAKIYPTIVDGDRLTTVGAGKTLAAGYSYPSTITFLVDASASAVSFELTAATATGSSGTIGFRGFGDDTRSTCVHLVRIK